MPAPATPDRPGRRRGRRRPHRPPQAGPHRQQHRHHPHPVHHPARPGAARPAPSPAELHNYLAGQSQLGLDRSQVAELLHGLEAKGLVADSAADGPGPTQLTQEGATLHAGLAEAIGSVTRRVYAGLDPDDLATTHRVLVEITERARRLRDQPEGPRPATARPQ